MIFHFMAEQKLVAEHYERYFDIIFHYKTTQNLDAKHYERYFDMIFHFTVAQNLVAAHFMKEILHDFPLYSGAKLGCRALCKIF